MTSRTLIVAFLLCTLCVPSLGQNLTNLLAALVRFSVAYESYQSSAANQSYYAYSSSNLASYLQQGQHGNSSKAENISLASSYVMDLALLTNAPNASSLLYPDEDGFNEFVNISREFVCQPTNCSQVVNSTIYRTLNGTCNNEEQPHWGSAFTAQERADGLRGSWERTSLVDYDLDQVPDLEYLFDTRAIGATPYFNERPFIIKILGDAAVRISVFSEENFNKFSTDVTCSGSPCTGYVEGAIFRIRNNGSCRVNEEVFFKENSNTFGVIDGSNSCTDKSYEVSFYSFVANVILEPESSSFLNELYIPDGGSDVSPDHKFEADEFSRYWMKLGSDKSIKISAGTEYSPSRIFLDSSMVLPSTPNLKKMFVSVGLVETSTVDPFVSLQFVNRDTYEVCTDGNIPMIDTNYGVEETLETIPFTYDYYVFRWGVDTKPNGKFNVTLTSTQDTNITLHVNMGNRGSSDLLYSSSAQQETANYASIQNVDFITAAGKRFANYDAFYLVWHDSYMYFGYGNQIGLNLITTQALNMTDITRFVVANVTLTSDSEACWVIDIEQINQPRLNSLSTGEPLPSAIAVGMLLHSNEADTTFSTEVTLATFQWGQFLDHDFIATALSTVGSHAPVCCNNSQFVTDDSYSEEFCFEIPITNDILDNTELGPFTTANGAECMDFVRSAMALSCDGDDVDFRVKQQVNVITTHIDASNVYGSSDEEVDSLRESGNAELHIQSNAFNNQAEMPKATTAGEACAVADVTKDLTVNGVTKSITVDCNHAGDFRSQEQSSLAGIHTLFVREHNRLVGELRTQGYDDSTPEGREELFQVVRHIVAGMIQVITYQAWLPSFLSNATLSKYKLLQTGCNYVPEKKKAVMKNIFGIIFRMGHTWIPNDLAGNIDTDIHLDAYDSLPLNNNYFNATPSYGNGSDHVMANWIKACPNTDRLMEPAVVKQLFGNLDGDLDNVALNLAALNIQRGRDHGVPTYKRIHEIFENDDDIIPQNIDDIESLNLTDAETISRLRRLYDSVEDIDAFTAGVAEYPKDTTTSVGKVINEILGDMFDLMKKGDRFWFGCYFSNQARQELLKVTLGKVMCDNMGNFNSSQTDVFRLGSSSNPNTTCSSRPSMLMSRFSKSNNGGRNTIRFPFSGSSTGGTSTREANIDQLLNFLLNLLKKNS